MYFVDVPVVLQHAMSIEKDSVHNNRRRGGHVNRSRPPAILGDVDVEIARFSLFLAEPCAFISHENGDGPIEPHALNVLGLLSNLNTTY